MTWLTLEECAEELRVEPRSVLRRTRTVGGPRFVRITRGKYRIRSEDWEAWLEGQRLRPDDEGSKGRASFWDD